jgi:multiple sugar transport system substrate-binding protein
MVWWLGPFCFDRSELQYVWRWFSAASQMALCLILLAACWSPWFNEEAATPVATLVAERTSKLQMMGWARTPLEDQRLLELIERFERAHPMLQVRVELVKEDYQAKLQAALLDDPPVDVVWVDSLHFPDLAAVGQLQPLGDWLDGVDDFDPTLRNTFTWNNQLYCAPHSAATLALFYHKGLFDQAGLAYPTSAWTWDDLKTAAEKLTNVETGVAGLLLNPDLARWLPLFYQGGATLVDANGQQMTINSPEALAILDFWLGLVQENQAKRATDLGALWPGEPFGHGKAAMTLEGNWLAPYLQAQFSTVAYGVAELPAGPVGRATLLFANCYAIPQGVANRDAALQLVNFLSGVEGAAVWVDQVTSLPIRISLRQEWLNHHTDHAAFATGMPYAQPWRFFPNFSRVIDSFNAGMESAYLNTRTPADILAEVEQVGNAALGAMLNAQR